MKYLGVVILSLVGMVGCSYGQTKKAADEGSTFDGGWCRYRNGVLTADPGTICTVGGVTVVGPPLTIPDQPKAAVHPRRLKGSHVVWLKGGGMLCAANDGSRNNTCRDPEQGEKVWHAVHPEDYTRSYYGEKP